MMDANSLIFHLDQILPDSQITEDVSRLLRESGNDEGAIVEIGGDNIYVPYDVNFKVVKKVLVKDDYNSGFGTFRAQIAIGNVTELEYGVIVPQFCFATLYYNRDCKLITADFHANFR
jgi:hypothetical protein